MEFIKSKWRTITFALLIICYLLFIVVMDKRVDLLYVAGVIYLLVTTLLFLGTIVGIPGIILHSFLKKEKAALPFYKGAVSLGSGNTNILAAYGLILLRDYQPGKALDLFQKAKAGSNHFLYHKTMDANISLCLWKMGKTEEASKTYEDLFYYPDLERIEDFSPENLEEGMNKNHNFYPQDFTTMAYLMFINGETEKCRYFSTISIEKADDYAPAYDNLGQLAYHEGDIDKAIGYFEKGLELKPSMSDSHYYLAKIALERQDPSKATEHLDAIDVGNINGLSTVTTEMISEMRSKIQ